MMRLRAQVRNLTGKTSHLQGVPIPAAMGVVRLPDPITVEVVEQDGGFYLLRLDGGGRCIADTWHETVEAAKGQASFEFDVEEGDWKTEA